MNKSTTLEKLKDRQKNGSCELECKRTIPNKNKGKPIVAGARPDWRHWEEFVCTIAKILVKIKGTRCYFYPLDVASISRDQWREHSHPFGTYIVHSGSIPVDIIEDWALWLSIDALRERSRRKHADGGYRQSTAHYLINGGLKDYEKVRSTVVSLQEHSRVGLNVELFLAQFEPITYDCERLEHDIKPIIELLKAILGGEESNGDLDLARAADSCMLCIA